MKYKVCSIDIGRREIIRLAEFANKMDAENYVKSKKKECGLVIVIEGELISWQYGEAE